MVMRWDPFGEALGLRDAMNRLFEQAVVQPGSGSRGSETATFAPAMDVREDKDGYTVQVSLPGVKPEDVNIQYEQGVLTISGETRAETEREEGTFHIRERRHGRFGRSVTLPNAVDADRADASFEHGVLDLRMPRAEESKPRRIAVHAGRSDSAPPIETSANGHSQPAGVGASA
ncbi:MAG TPA: Hsp20/alpha crystallin family protein [Dehalococcoidia bacterium]|nr:Hsp20/alpha crystallin family protein [Dehalococcoidia bacterium]